MPDASTHQARTTRPALDGYPLLDALIERRSRRFGAGMRLDGGPLDYASARPSLPLSLEEEAALAFAGAGITGYALAELPYRPGGLPATGGGYIMTHFVGRTAASGDAMHDNALFVLNDDGAWMLKRPQELARDELPNLVRGARERRLVELYERTRIRIADRRPDVPREVPFVPPFNKWSANQPGTTYFLPIAECTALSINILLSMFDDEFAHFVVDERNGYQPAGIAPFGRSRGGHLHDDPRDGRYTTVGAVETWLYEFIAIEQGAILQNLGLVTQALGLGGFPHFAAHPFIWPLVLGFRMIELPFSRLAGVDASDTSAEPHVPTPIGLERDGQALLKPFCPPYYRTMEEAVLAFVQYKYAEGHGTFRDGGGATAWQDGARIQAGIPSYPDRAIEAAAAYAEYVYRRYGRFPAHGGPFRTVLAYQAHHLDPDFYDRFYRSEALSDTQRQHPDH